MGAQESRRIIVGMHGNMEHETQGSIQRQADLSGSLGKCSGGSGQRVEPCGEREM